jgi:signal transduction histidine kinase
VGLFLLLVAGFRPAVVVALGWGFGIACHYFGAIAAPEMRRRLLEREVRRQVATDAPRERRSLEDSHVRSLEDLSDQVAHEIRNPITAAKSLVQQMEEDPGASENMEYARVALAELSRVERQVAHLLRYARDEEMRVGDVRLADVVESALETFRDRLSRAGIEVERRIEIDGRLEGDAEQLRRAVINLIGIAVDAAEQAEPGPGRVELHLGENLAGSAVWLRVADNGPGLDDEALARMWSPYYTQKSAGTGLGLAITRKLVESHGGEIEAGAGTNGGAEFTISLPKRCGGRA